MTQNATGTASSERPRRATFSRMSSTHSKDGKDGKEGKEAKETKEGKEGKETRDSIKEGNQESRRSSVLEGHETSAIKVIARIRPKMPKEHFHKDGVEVMADGVSVQLSDGTDKKHFTLDDVIDSRVPEGSQSVVFSRFGRDLLNHSMNGYNVCIFAYGHTGSGKTFTILGSGLGSGIIGDDTGILPRYIAQFFDGNSEDPNIKDVRYGCEFYEVYNEEIRDLLAPSNSNRKRTVHVHPKHGVRIEGLSVSVVTKSEEAMGLVNFGNQMRTVAATTMNERSSRSHAIFSLKCEKTTNESSGKPPKTVKCSITFVDLAGREDHEASGNNDQQMRETCYINSSLFHLAHLISKISENQVKKGNLADFRNSKLTLLLSHALVGNSRTGLIATLAPVQSFYDCAVSTLQFAQNVKKIKTKTFVDNKNSQTAVAELEAEIRKLRKELNDAKCSGTDKESELLAAQSMMSYYKQSWEEVVGESAETSRQRKRIMTNYGLAAHGELHPAVDDTPIPFLTKLSDDPALQGCCNYILNQSSTVIGSDRTACSLILDGVGIRPVMCEVLVDDNMKRVTIKLCGNLTSGDFPRILVGGSQLKPDIDQELEHGDSIILGFAHALRLCIPEISEKPMKTYDLAHTTLDGLDMASAISEISEMSGSTLDNAMLFLQSLGQKTSEYVVQNFMQDLQCICPLVDEANQLTKEVWGERSTIVFKLHCLTNIFGTEEDSVPELAVCVCQEIEKLKTLKDTKDTDTMGSNSSLPKVSRRGQKRDTQKLLGNMRHPEVVALGLGSHMKIGSQSLLYLWSLEKFLRRLNAFRDIYQAGHESPDGFQTIRDRLDASQYDNPWRELSFAQTKIIAEDLAGGKTPPEKAAPAVSLPIQVKKQAESQVSEVVESARARVSSASTDATKQTPTSSQPSTSKLEHGVSFNPQMWMRPSPSTVPPSKFSLGDPMPQNGCMSPICFEAASCSPSVPAASSPPSGSATPRGLRVESAVAQNTPMADFACRGEVTPTASITSGKEAFSSHPKPNISLTSSDLDELRAELQKCRTETGRFIEEQNRLAGFFARVDGLLGRVGQTDTGQTTDLSPDKGSAGISAKLLSGQKQRLQFFCQPSGATPPQTSRSCSPRPSFAIPNYVMMKSIPKSKPVLLTSVARPATPIGPVSVRCSPQVKHVSIALPANPATNQFLPVAQVQAQLRSVTPVNVRAVSPTGTTRQATVPTQSVQKRPSNSPTSNASDIASVLSSRAGGSWGDEPRAGGSWGDELA